MGMAGSGSKWVKMAGNGWTLLEMANNGQIGWKWL